MVVLCLSGCQMRTKKMTMPNQVVKVRKEKLALCMTCSLCNKLYKDAATISECLHTCECFFSSHSPCISR